MLGILVGPLLDPGKGALGRRAALPFHSGASSFVVPKRPPDDALEFVTLFNDQGFAGSETIRDPYMLNGDLNLQS